MAYRRFNRFGTNAQPSAGLIRESSLFLTRKRSCSGCKLVLAAGETVRRVQTRKAHRRACSACGSSPDRARYYHDACYPTDLLVAMHVETAPRDPNAPPPPPPPARTVAPPVKPPTVEDATVLAIATLENALLTRVRARQLEVTPDVQKKFDTFQKLKQHVLRPGSDQEGLTATRAAIKALLDLVIQ